MHQQYKGKSVPSEQFVDRTLMTMSCKSPRERLNGRQEKPEVKNKKKDHKEKQGSD